MRSITATRAEGQSIGELSRATGVNIEASLQADRNMLPSPRRTEGGHQVYGPAERRSLAFIRRARELGFTLDEIRALLALGGPGKASCRDVREIAAHHLEDIRCKIADLSELEKLLAKCSGKVAPIAPSSTFWQTERSALSTEARRQHSTAERFSASSTCGPWKGPLSEANRDGDRDGC